MTKRLLPAVLTIVILLVPEHATAARSSLALGPTPVLLEDDVTVFSFPFALVRYGNHVYAISSADDSSNPLLVQRPELPLQAVFDSNAPVGNDVDTVDLAFTLSAEPGPVGGISLSGGISGLTGGFTLAGFWRFETDAQGTLTLLQKIIKAGETLPDGVVFGGASTGQQGGGRYVFSHLNGMYYADETLQLNTIVDSGFLFPSSGFPLLETSAPAAGAEIIAFSAQDTVGNAGLFFYSPGQADPLQLAYEFEFGGLAWPSLAQTDTGTTALWLGIGPGPQFSSVIQGLSPGDTTPAVLVDANEPVEGGGTVFGNSIFEPVVATSVGSELCVAYPANFASAPGGDYHLFRTCGTPGGARTTELLLSPGDVIDGETITGFQLDADAADGASVAVRAFIQSGGIAVVLIEDDAIDADFDGVPDDMDNCIDVANPLQGDTDGDSIGNACDADVAEPNDCVVNVLDLAVFSNHVFTGSGDAGYNADVDFNLDAEINFIDLGQMKATFFQSPGPSGLPNACAP